MALHHVAFPGVRARGTVGGSIAHADPASERRRCCSRSAARSSRAPGGERTIPADDLFVTYFTTALQPDEVLTHVRFPRGHLQTGFAEVARKAGDFALAGVAVALGMDDGTCCSARVALFAFSDRPLRATGAEQALAGRTLAEGATDAARLASEEIDAKSDSHATAQYRRTSSACSSRGRWRRREGEG